MVELEVVEVCVVGLDALEEQVARLLHVGVDGDVEVVDGRVQRVMDGVTLEVGSRRGLLEIFAGTTSGELVEEGRQKVRVVDVDGELGEDVAESQLGLLQAVEGESVLASQKSMHIRFDLTYISVVNLPSL